MGKGRRGDKRYKGSGKMYSLIKIFKKRDWVLDIWAVLRLCTFWIELNIFALWNCHKPMGARM